ncbi:MAG: bifunctional phosphopantothenoylcysteine decarboxylase/phosphopantothenate--cysteine ligase CoaBC [Parvularcula sp.]
MSGSVLLIVGGGIAAYKSLELIRALKRESVRVTTVLTQAGSEFITPLSLSSLSREKCYTDLFSLKDEVEMGHIELSRAADLVVVAPATADLLAKPANGLANDLASTLLLATDKPVLYAPAMNVRMWEHAAVQRNVHWLNESGAMFVGPDEGEMACGEFGFGRMAEPQVIASHIVRHLSGRSDALSGHHILVTAGPTHEPIDPVRYLANRSSGKQGYAIAQAAHEAGARVTLVSGPTDLPDPPGVTIVRVETALDMQEACKRALPCDAAILCAAVADYRPATVGDQKLKKDKTPLKSIPLTENPDILAALSGLSGPERPALVIGFAAETENVLEHATEKRARKGCDWIVANDVSAGTGTMGGNTNAVTLIKGDAHQEWTRASKDEIARRLVDEIARALSPS